MTSYDDLIKYTKKLNVLYAEDNLEIGEIIKDYLDILFNKSVSAQDGKIAWEEYQKNSNNFDLVILDIEMPHLTGLEVAEKIKEINLTQAIVLLTAYDDYDYMADALALQIEEYILKPIVEADFLKKLYEITKKIHNRKNEAKFFDDNDGDIL